MLGKASCILFGIVVACGVGAAIAYAVTPEPQVSGEWTGLNRLPWDFAVLLLGAAGWGLSLIGFGLGLAGLMRGQKRTATVTGIILNGLVAVPIAVWLLVITTR